jgi:hypothetical protein
MTAPNPGELVAALASGLTRLTRRVGDQGDELRALGQAVAALTPPAAREPVTPTLDGAPEAAVVDLLDWLAEVYLAYDGSTLAPCWPWHPGVVEELAVLRGIHRVIYAEPDWLRLGDWHDRYRPGVVRRVAAALGGCDIGRHVDTLIPGTRTVPLGDALGPIYTARANKAPIPAPSDAQVVLAKALSSRTKSTR